MTSETRLRVRPAVGLQTLLFDLGGTLVDSLHDIVLSYALRVLGLEVPAYEKETREALRWRGYKLAVATTKRTPVAERLLRAVGLENCVDFIQGTDGFAHKPAPAVIYRVLARAGKAAPTVIAPDLGVRLHLT